MTDPTPPMADPLVARLRNDAAQNTGGGVLLLFGGALATLLTAALIAFVFELVVGLPGMSYTAWTFVFAVLLAGAGVAWLRARPKLLAGRAFEYTDPRAEWAGVGKYDGVTAVLGAAADVALIGPRMVEAGVRQGAGKEPASRERFFDRCALLLRQLARIGEQTKLDAVRIGDDETDDKLKPVLDYLDRTDWCGFSSDRTRLWLSSRAKNELPMIGVPLSVPEA